MVFGSRRESHQLMMSSTLPLWNPCRLHSICIFTLHWRPIITPILWTKHGPVHQITAHHVATAIRRLNIQPDQFSPCDEVLGWGGSKSYCCMTKQSDEFFTKHQALMHSKLGTHEGLTFRTQTPPGRWRLQFSKLVALPTFRGTGFVIFNWVIYVNDATQIPQLRYRREVNSMAQG